MNDMNDPDETWEERAFREQAEHEAWLEAALARLESGLRREDIEAGLKRYASYMRTQIAEDNTAMSELAAYEAGYEFPPTMRDTRSKDRAGLELGLMLLVGKIDGGAPVT